MMTIIALDPGRTVGWATFKKPNARDGYKSGQIKWDATWSLLDSALIETHDIHLVVESFKHRQLPKIDYTPVEVIGVVKEWARQNDVNITWQTPSQAKFFWTDERLKDYTLYRPGKPHANDAMRHLLYYLNFHPSGRLLGEGVIENGSNQPFSSERR